MSGASALIYSDSYQSYRFSPEHPLKPVRLLLTYELIRDYGLLEEGGVRLVEPRAATDAELATVHDPEYIAKVRELSAPDAGITAAAGWGLGPGDNPVFPGMHEAAATGAGGALVAAEMIMKGEALHIFHMGGGLHHALRAKASGFCIYNDPALAITYLRREHGARVAYLDFDAHHGDGVQYAFYDDPEVLTLSFHESGMYLFPGTGFTSESGGADAPGSSVNVPLLPYTTDDIYLEAFDALAPDIVRAFDPDVIVTQNGCDAHWSDPLSHLSLTLSGFRELDNRLHGLIHETAGGRWLALGGGGYEAYTVVPRAWTILMAVLADAELGARLPEEWRRECAALYAEGAVPEMLYSDPPPDVPEQQKEKALRLAMNGVEEIRRALLP